MDKPDNVRLLEALGEACEPCSCGKWKFAGGRHCSEFDEESPTGDRLWLLEEMERRNLLYRLFDEVTKDMRTSAEEVLVGMALAFSKLSNEDLMRAALAVLE